MEFSLGAAPLSDVRTDFHWMNRALGLVELPPAATDDQSDQVLSGELVFPLRVNTCSSSGCSAFQESLPQVEMASVSRTIDSYVPDVAKASPRLNSFPILAVAA